jgi:RHS repeat-associated protein
MKTRKNAVLAACLLVALDTYAAGAPSALGAQRGDATALIRAQIRARDAEWLSLVRANLNPSLPTSPNRTNCPITLGPLSCTPQGTVTCSLQVGQGVLGEPDPILCSTPDGANALCSSDFYGGAYCVPTNALNTDVACTRTNELAPGVVINPFSDEIFAEGSYCEWVTRDPIFSFAAAGLTFSPTKVGTSSIAQAITINNTGTGILTLSPFVLTGDYAATATTCGAQLPPASSCNVSVTFTPTAVGARPGALSLSTNAAGSPHSVSLAGTGYVTGPLPILSPSPLAFGAVAVGSSSPSQAITLSNAGDLPFSQTGITVGAPFAFQQSCPTIFAPGASCALDVTFTPAVIGPAAGSISVTTDVAAAPLSALLTGDGLDPALAANPTSFTPSSVSFGTHVVNVQSGAKVVTIKNISGAPLTFVGITITQPFTIVSTTCGTGLLVDEECTVTVTFDPTIPGTYTGGLVVTTTTSTASPQIAPITGTAILTITQQSSLSLNPSALYFTDTLAGTTSAPQVVTVTNTGSASVPLGGRYVGLGFRIVADNCPNILPVAQSCQVSITFESSNDVPVNGSLTVPGYNVPSLTSVPLLGVALLKPVLQINPTSFVFNAASQIRFGIVTNIGNAPLRISGYTFGTSSSRFSVQGTTCSQPIPPGQSCALNLEFGGSVNATDTLTIASNASTGGDLVPLAAYPPPAVTVANGGTRFPPQYSLPPFDPNVNAGYGGGDLYADPYTSSSSVFQIYYQPSSGTGSGYKSVLQGFNAESQGGYSAGERIKSGSNYFEGTCDEGCSGDDCALVCLAGPCDQPSCQGEDCDKGDSGDPNNASGNSKDTGSKGNGNSTDTVTIQSTDGTQAVRVTTTTTTVDNGDGTTTTTTKTTTTTVTIQPDGSATVEKSNTTTTEKTEKAEKKDDTQKTDKESTPTETDGGNKGETEGDSSDNAAGSTGLPTDDTLPVEEVAEPIHSSTGSKVQVQTDFLGFGALPLRFVRTYNSAELESHQATNIPIGNHWRASLDLALRVDENGNVVKVFRADGKRYIHLRNPDGSFSATQGSKGRLSAQVDSVTGQTVGYSYLTRRGQLETYDRAGRLLRMSRGRLSIQLRYDLQGRPLKAIDTFGRSLTLQYAGGGNLAALILPDGSSIQYQYDGAGNLVGVTSPGDRSVGYRYTDPRFPSALTELIDVDGKPAFAWTYDGLGRVTQSKSVKTDNTVTLEYLDYKTITTDAYGTKRTRTFGNVNGRAIVTSLSTECPGGCNFEPILYSYDARGQLIEIRHGEQVKRFEYDRQGLQRAIIEAVGTKDERRTTMDWNAGARRITAVHDGERTASMETNAAGYVTKRTLSAANEQSIESRTYDSENRLLRVQRKIGEGSNETNWEYSSSGQILSATGTASGRLTYLTFDKSGRPTSWQLPDSRVVNVSYDGFGRLLTRNVGEKSWNRAYDANGQLQTFTTPAGRKFTYEYDGLLHNKTFTDSAGGAIEFARDRSGNVVSRIERHKSGSVSRIAKFARDGLGRIVSQTFVISPTQEAKPTQIEYDGHSRVHTLSDPLSRLSTFTYDALNRRTVATNPEGGSTKLQYNRHDELETFTTPRGIATEYFYSLLGNPIAEASPDRGMLSREFDATGLLVRTQDAKRNIATYKFDLFGRISSVRYANDQSVLFGYATSPSLAGLPEMVQDSAGTTSYEYDGQGRVTRHAFNPSSANSSANATRVQTYFRDALGRVTQMTTPAGNTVSYSYETIADTSNPSQTIELDRNLFRLATISVNGKQLISDIRYAPTGEVANYTLANGRAVERLFDNRGHLIQHPTATGVQRLTYDDAGQIVHISDIDSTGRTVRTQSLDYDRNGRLNRFEAQPDNHIESYDYDADGNRTAHTVNQTRTSFEYDKESNRLVGHSVGTAPESAQDNTLYNYDSNGSLVQLGNQVFSYDARGRMTRAQTNDVNASYAYTTDGLRTQKTLAPRNGSGATSSTHFSYDLAGHLIGEYGEELAHTNGCVGTACTARETIWWGNRPIALIENAARHDNDKEVLLVYTDHIGSPREVTKQDSTIVWKWVSDPFGWKEPISSSAYTLNIRFPGQYFDAETGLHQNRFRDYDPFSGRYIQGDPIGMRGGANAYAYVAGNPINRIDPSGLLFGGFYDLGECAGANAAQWWADKQVETDNPLYAIPGLFASLWTPTTSDATVGTLAAGYGATGVIGSIGNFGEWLSNPFLYELGSKTLSDAAFSALGGLSTIERGAAIAGGGVFGALFNLSGNWLKTWGTGPTPGASLFLLAGGTSQATLGGDGKKCGCK